MQVKQIANDSLDILNQKIRKYLFRRIIHHQKRDYKEQKFTIQFNKF